MKTRDLVECALSFQKSRVLLTAYELEIFSAIGAKSVVSAEVAAKRGYAPRHTDRLMNALAALGLLKKNGGRFSNTAASLKYLVKTSPHFVRSIGHNVNMWDTWGALTETIRRGRPATEKAMNDRGDKWLVPFIAAMHERARASAEGIVRSIGLSGVSRVLDVGGGSGAYAMAFARARKGIKATVFDLPNVVPITRKYIKEEGLSDKVDVVSGDYNYDRLGRGYDLVFLSAIVHANSPEQNKALVQRAQDALNGGGRIVIQDFIMDEDRVHPAFGAFFALNMLVATGSGDTYTESEVKGWLKEAGFIDRERADTRFGTTLVTGRKKTAKR